MDENIKYRTIGVMLGIFLLMLGYLLMLPELRERGAATGAFITGSHSVRQVVGISIEMPDGTSISYARRDGDWRLREPYRAAAVQPVLDELLGALQKTRIMETIEAHPEDLSAYGLEAGQRIEVAVEFEDGAGSSFRIGGRLPLNRLYVYFQKDNDPEVFRVWEGIRDTLERHAELLGRGRPVQFDPEDVVSLTLRRETRTLVLRKRQGSWFVVRPVERAADNEAVRTYLASVLALSSTGAPPAGALDESMAEGPDGLSITVERDGGQAPIGVRLIPGAKDETLLMVERDGRWERYEADGEEVARLHFEPEDFYLPSALEFDRDEITDIEIRHPRFVVELGREPDGVWQVRQPSGVYRADAGAVGQLLYLLHDLPVGAYLDSGVQPEAPQEADILVTLSAGRAATVLQIKEDDGGYRGRSRFHPGWFRLSEDWVKSLSEFDPEELIDRDLLVFDPRNVEQLRIERHGTAYLMARQKDEWVLKQPHEKKIGNAALWKLVFDIRDLQYHGTAGSDTPSTPETGRCVGQEPDITVAVTPGESEPLLLRLQADRTGHDWLVSSSRLPGCYRLERTVFEPVIQDLERIVEQR